MPTQSKRSRINRWRGCSSFGINRRHVSRRSLLAGNISERRPPVILLGMPRTPNLSPCAVGSVAPVVAVLFLTHTPAALSISIRVVFFFFFSCCKVSPNRRRR